MRVSFTKMQGAGNDFVVLDETAGKLNLSRAQYRFLADRHFGVGADQILSVRRAPAAGLDFEYVIHNADGQEVEQCGNGARCFARFVHQRGLSTKTQLRVLTRAGVIEPQLQADGSVTVDMGAPRFALDAIPFNPAGLQREAAGDWEKWLLARSEQPGAALISIAVLSMGNPHAVLLCDDAQTAPVAQIGAWLQAHQAFPASVNVGFLQVLTRHSVRLRVFERGVGETLACGSGACAAVVAGIRLGLLERRVDVQTLGGLLTIDWAGAEASVLMSGPATTVFEGQIDLPEAPVAPFYSQTTP